MLKKILVALVFMGAMLQAAEAPSETSVTQIYVATYDRASDAAGLEYWANSGLSDDQIAASFSEQDETKEKYPDEMTNSEFIDQVYLNIFDHAPDPAGKAYWLKELDSGAITRSLFIIAVVNGALDDDKKILDNKTTVSLAFSDDGRNDVEEAYDILEHVTADPRTVPTTLCVYDLGECPALILVISPASSYCLVGEKVAYTSTAVFEGGLTLDVTEKSQWSTSDSDIATIGQNGVASCANIGKSVISAAYSINGESPYNTGTANLEVMVDEPTFQSLEIDGLDMVSVGLTVQLTAIATLSDDSTYDVNDKVNWTSSSASATVDAMGVVTGVSVGDVVITATAKTDNSIFATHAITVTAAASTIEIQEGCSASETVVIDDSNPLELSVGEEKCINAWLVNADGDKERVTTTVFWKSETPNIASMDLWQRSSYVTGVAIGSATVSATLDGVTGSAPVNVSAYIPGTIRRSNFVDVDDISLVVATPPTSATGRADGTLTGGGFYYTASTDGTYSEGDLVKDTNFEYDATMTNAQLFVNVYTEQTDTCPTGRLDIGAYDATVPYTYDTWNDAKNDPALAMCELRNAFNGLSYGNFFLRFGGSTYVGTDAFSLDSYIVN